MTTNKYDNKNINNDDNNKQEDEFEITSHDDAEEAIRLHITSLIMNHPEIKKMKPNELSKFIKNSINSSLFKRKKFVRLWSFGSSIYRYSALGYTVFTVYQHPILAKMAIIGCWTIGKAIIVSTIGLF
jgi:hypothetical protein